MQLKFLFVTLLIAVITSSSCTSVEKIRYTTEELEAMEKFDYESAELTLQPQVDSMCVHQNMRYPTELRNRGVEGRVIVEFDVTPNGQTRNFKILRTDHELFSEVTIASIQNCRFKPGEINGTAVYVAGLIHPQVFRLQ